MTAKITYLGKTIYPAVRRQANGRYTFKSYISLQWARLRAWTWKWTKRAAFVAMLVGIAFAIYWYGTMNGQTISATNIIPLAHAEVAFPILDRIAMAESHGSQICTAEIAKNGWCHSYEVGAPLVHANANGTYDIGKYQINSTHLKEAIAMGYNVYEEKDNEAFARYLFTTQGSEPWQSSKAGWKQ